MTRRMFRYTVPADHAPHVHTLWGSPVAVALTFSPGGVIPVVEFWAESNDEGDHIRRTFQVFGTGDKLPEGARYVETCPRETGLVWHLYELESA